MADKWSVSDASNTCWKTCQSGDVWSLRVFFSSAASRSEVIVTFLAVLELIKLNHLEIEQDGMLGPILVIRPSL